MENNSTSIFFMPFSRTLKKFEEDNDYSPRYHDILYYEEESYLALMKKILIKGKIKPTRCGTNTRSICGGVLEFSLFDEIKGKRMVPLLTTKTVFWTAILKELFFFISGQTDAKILSDQGINIWNNNSSREYLDKIGLTERREGDLGPVYGFAWRHFGAEYIDCNTDYTGKGFDQLQWVIEELKTNPYSRRLLISAWNPLDLNKVVLPPCHVSFQFIVDPPEKEGELKILNCVVYQRSVDVPLGLPFNLVSYSVLTHIISHLVGMQPGQLIYNMGDIHIYENQISMCEIQLERRPYPFPTITIEDIGQKNIEDYKFNHITLEGYRHHPLISFPFST